MSCYNFELKKLGWVIRERNGKIIWKVGVNWKLRFFYNVLSRRSEREGDIGLFDIK